MGKNLGNRIRSIREERNLSITDLAARSSISRGYLYLVESGKSNPTEEKLSAIAQALGVLVSDLTGELEAAGQLLDNIPESLREFADQEGLTSADINMLSKINYRGKQPKTALDWKLLYSVIKGTLDKE